MTVKEAMLAMDGRELVVDSWTFPVGSGHPLSPFAAYRVRDVATGYTAECAAYRRARDNRIACFLELARRITLEREDAQEAA